ncbi:putative WEB family protein [Helianthus debilis subsp. tardiflorus]
MDEAGENGEVESKTEVMGTEANNGKGGGFGSLLSEQIASEEEQTLTDSKASIDDRFKPSPETAIQQTQEKHSNHKLSDSMGQGNVIEDGVAGHDHVRKSGHVGQDHVQEDDLTGQDNDREEAPAGNDHIQEVVGLKPSLEPAIQQTVEKQSNNKLFDEKDDYSTSQNNILEDGVAGHDHVKESGPTGQDHVREDDPTGHHHVQEDGVTGQDHVQKDGPTGQDHVKKSSPTGQGHVKESSPTGQGHVKESSPTGQDHVRENGKIDNHEEKGLETVSTEKPIEKSKSSNAEIDTTAPFESVKAAVSMFGGIVDWKAHKIQIAERRRYVAQELRKANEQMPILKKQSEAAEESKQQALKELDNAKRLLEELRINTERAETEEQQAKQDAELAKLRVEEMEQGIADESSIAAKTQLEVAQARHQAAVSELKTVKIELDNLQKDYGLLLAERDLAIKNAEQAEFNSKEIEKNVEELTIKLITTKEALESAHAAHLEAEENLTGVAIAQEEEILQWQEELKQSEEESEKVNQQIAEMEDLKSKIDTASVLLQNLKVELGAYMEENHKDIQSAVDSAKMDLEEVKKNIEKVTDEVNSLKQSATLLNSELEHEKETFISAKKKDELAGVSAESLEADLKRTILEVELIQKKEKEAREKALLLPRQLEQATEEADQAKSHVQKAQQDLQKAKEAADQAKTGENNMISKLNAALKEIEATRASERLALGAISALHESESTRSNKSENESGVTLSVEEYYELSRKAKGAEDEADTRVSEAVSQIDLAKEAELKAENKLEQVNSDIALKKEQLVTATQRAEKAKEGKEAFEQELRTWKTENEQKTKASKSTKGNDSHKPDSKTESSNSGIGSSREVKRKKKRRSFFPRFFMFFTRKRGHSSKNNT